MRTECTPGRGPICGTLSVLIVCFSLAAAGCATRRTVMVNDAGSEITCETRGYGFIAALAAAGQQDECIRDAEKRGYRAKPSAD